MATLETKSPFGLRSAAAFGALVRHLQALVRIHSVCGFLGSLDLSGLLPSHRTLVLSIPFRDQGSPKIGDLRRFVDHSSAFLSFVSDLSSALGGVRRQEGYDRYDMVLGLGGGAGEGSPIGKRFDASEGNAFDLSSFAHR